MEIKRVHIAYFSPTGTTKRTLRAVAEGFGCSELSETDWGDPKSRAAILKTGPDELVIAGMPVYYGRIPSLFHEGLPLHGEGTPFVPVAVYGNRHYDDAVLELKTLGEAAGCVTLGAAAFVAQHCLNPDMGRGRPDASDLAVMKRFGSALRARTRSTNRRRSRPSCWTPKPVSAAACAPGRARFGSLIPRHMP